jgi:hypothetical protein
LALHHFDNGVPWGSRVSMVDHYINSTKGTNRGLFRVPATVKNHGCVNTCVCPSACGLADNYRYYSLIMNAWEVNNETDIPNPSAVAYTSSNMFIIYGGPELHPREIAGVVIGSFVALVLVAGAFVGVAWYVRRRGSWAAAAGFSGGNVERYTDAA